MNYFTIPTYIKGMEEPELSIFQTLMRVLIYHSSANRKKEKYYEGKISLNDVNLGIALPQGMGGLEIGCAWGAKTVDVLAARSMFDGFVDVNGANNEELNYIVSANRLITEYKKACRDELKFGCTFATLSADPVSKCRIRFHSPQTAAAVWDGEKGRIKYGLAIIDTTEKDKVHRPSLINMYTDESIWVIRRIDENWFAEENPHRMGRPLIEPLIWNATSSKPLGRSRIKEPIRRLIDGYVRTIANATIGLEFSTAPQKYLLGVTDDQYDAVINQKFQQYVGNILASTVNPETGEKPTFGQLSQGSITPHVEMLRVLSTQFSAATGLSVTDTGVVNDANPTSSDAILAQTQTLVATAEELNSGNGDALKTIALMALAIANNTTMENLSDDQLGIIAHFKNPAMPSIAATSDAAIKIASARENFAQTDTFLEMIGFDQSDIRRIRAQEQRVRGIQILNEVANEDNTESMG